MWRRVNSPGRRFAGPALSTASCKEGELQFVQIKPEYFSPSLRFIAERVDERSKVGVSQLTAMQAQFPANPYLYPMRIMAFDYGTKRIGIAVTDPMQIIATGLDTIHPNQIIEYLKKYLLTEPVERFIVGEPKQMDNTPSQSAIHVKGFVNLLKKTFPDIPVEMLDERFTSKMASATIAQSGMNKKHRQNKELVDTISAVILLQSWMEGRAF
jgi:putative Holliday junction resolvase